MSARRGPTLAGRVVGAVTVALDATALTVARPTPQRDLHASVPLAPRLPGRSAVRAAAAERSAGVP